MSPVNLKKKSKIFCDFVTGLKARSWPIVSFLNRVENIDIKKSCGADICILCIPNVVNLSLSTHFGGGGPASEKNIIPLIIEFGVNLSL